MDSSKTRVVTGDVNRTCGNVKHFTDIVINGSVCDGMEVLSGGCITVTGGVGDAVLKAKADVSVTGDCKGDGTGCIDARGCVAVGCVVHQRIQAGGDVLVNGKADDATIVSQGRVTIKGDPGAIAGGSITTLFGFRADSAGNEHRAKTEIIVGNPDLFRKKSEALVRLHTLKGERNAVRNQMDELNRLKKINYQRFQNQVGVLEMLMEKELQIEETVQTIINGVSSYTPLLEKLCQARVEIQKTVFPGVIVTINDATYTVTRQMNSVIFLYEEGKVTIRGVESEGGKTEP